MSGAARLEPHLISRPRETARRRELVREAEGATSLPSQDVKGGVRSLGEVVDPKVSPHVFVLQRKVPKPKRGDAKKPLATLEFALQLSTVLSPDGSRRLGFALDEANREPWRDPTLQPL